MRSKQLTERGRATIRRMGRFIITLVVVLAAGGLFAYRMQYIAPEEAPQPEPQQPASVQSVREDIFGEGAGVVGPLEGGATTEGVITREVLEGHATADDCWVAYKDVVYDITDWLPLHPGTAAAITPYCGTAEEFAAAFNEQHGTMQEKRLEKEGEPQGTLEDQEN